MEALTFTNSRGQSVVLGDSAPYVILKISGMGGVENIIETQRGYKQDGVSVVGYNLNSRLINIAVAVLGENREVIAEKKAELGGVLNSMLGQGTLTYTLGGLSKQIGCIIKENPTFERDLESDMENAQLTNITILCESPFWEDIETSNDIMKDWVGGFRFTLRLPTTFSQRGSLRAFENNGHAPTPLRIKFFGNCTNPSIKNEDSGEFIKVNQPLLPGEVLEITTDLGDKKVLIHREDGSTLNALGYLDPDSTFFGLDLGSNTVSYSADSGAEDTKVLLEWRERFLTI